MSTKIVIDGYEPKFENETLIIRYDDGSSELRYMSVSFEELCREINPGITNGSDTILTIGKPTEDRVTGRVVEPIDIPVSHRKFVEEILEAQDREFMDAEDAKTYELLLDTAVLNILNRRCYEKVA